ncbi:MAG: ABC transporter substrate-binding protein [Gammaproteobacteria bacterium]|nr:ABC transporter substrate-binding protein [Gammaproteobacteria bacterium]MBU1443441.1 ABC transporter substrate-binding protein [Gammaproteobacteria bacterium]
MPTFTSSLRRSLIAASVAAAVLPFGAAVQAQPAPTEIRVSYQPALYWALPMYVASEKGYWAEMGLKPVFSIFPAGVPQMAAAAAKSWAVGGTGSVPAVLGHVRFGIKTIGLTNDESAGNALLASKDMAAKIAKSPKDAIKGQTILLTSNSTGDYAVQSCLKKWGLSKSDVTIKNMGQSEIISAISSKNADLGGLWAPNIYSLEEKAGATVVCSGKEGGAIVPGALVARSDYAEEHPELVAKFLAVYLRAWSWMNANQAEAIVLMRKFYDQGGVGISEASMKKEFDTRPTFDLSQQLAAMDRSQGASKMDGWFSDIATFMKGTGAIQSVPGSADYITDTYMKRVKADPKLSAFANNSK